MGRVHVAIINLSYRKSRRQRILRLVEQLEAASQFTSCPIVSVNFIEAVDGVRQSFSELESRYGLKPFANWAIEDADNKYPSSWRVAQTSGGIASGLSHLDVAAMAKKFEWVQNNDYVLVMEDDCALTANPEAAYGHFLNCLSDANRYVPEWDMVMLGAAGHRPDIAPSIEAGTASIERAGFSYLTTMYWLSNHGVEYLTRTRSICVANGLAFDELHNALAGLTGRVRPDVERIFSKLGPLVLLSARQSLVRQDPHDCVHDTAVTRRRRSSVEDEDVDVLPPGAEISDPQQLEQIEPFQVKEKVFWFRRRPQGLVTEEVLADFLPKKRSGRVKSVKAVLDEMREPLEKAEVTSPRAPKFGLMATLMRKKRESVVVDSSNFPKSFFELRE